MPDIQKLVSVFKYCKEFATFSTAASTDLLKSGETAVEKLSMPHVARENFRAFTYLFRHFIWSKSFNFLLLGSFLAYDWYFIKGRESINCLLFYTVGRKMNFPAIQEQVWDC